MNAEEFRKVGKEMIDYVADYLENIEKRPVLSSVKPGYLHHLIPEEAPQDPEKWEDVFNDIESYHAWGTYLPFWCYFRTCSPSKSISFKVWIFFAAHTLATSSFPCLLPYNPFISQYIGRDFERRNSMQWLFVGKYFVTKIRKNEMNASIPNMRLHLAINSTNIFCSRLPLSTTGKVTSRTF